jgi:hypothetical protein
LRSAGFFSSPSPRDFAEREEKRASTRFGKLPVYVGLWDVSEDVLAGMRRESGIAASVFENAAVSALGQVA